MERRNGGPSTTEVDMTPMIDIVFQLMTFFIFTLNFSEAEQDDRIQLPLSQLAKPVPGPVEKPITLQVTNTSSVIYAGELVPVLQIGGYLEREKASLVTAGRQPAEATVIVRADGRAKTGEVQEVVKICQEKGFEKFALRAQYDEQE
ncbi:MAG: biopolymer transporter ExbD [Planctomycetota bacterium]|jgi:biopolymer transport protein ExbD|nr:biopolymer transporter ExbD [Planctomycetota bacterium]